MLAKLIGHILVAGLKQVADRGRANLFLISYEHMIKVLGQGLNRYLRIEIKFVGSKYKERTVKQK